MAPLLPKLRGQFAEFLNNASPVRLRILSSSTCVGLRYEHLYFNSIGFSRQCDYACFPTSFFGIPFGTCSSSCTLKLLSCVPNSFLMYRWCRNFHLLPIGYAFQPHLRSRLTLGGRTFPRNP